MIPRNFYSVAARGSYVFHDSLLPKYRGFAPTVWAMINGEAQTGATLLEMIDEVDAGEIIAQQAVAINEQETIAQVMEKVTGAYLDLLSQNFRAIKDGTAKKFPQNHAAATYCCKRLPEDNEINWTHGQRQVHDLIRATTFPYPGAFTQLGGRRLTVWSACRAEGFPHYAGRVPGRVAQVSRTEGPVVLCGDGAIQLKVVQWEGAERQPAGEVIHNLGVTLDR
jgi:methionyl-tRNA formyltransferase